MSPVEFKKTLCRPVKFKGQGPSYGLESSADCCAWARYQRIRGSPSPSRVVYLTITGGGGDQERRGVYV